MTDYPSPFELDRIICGEPGCDTPVWSFPDGLNLKCTEHRGKREYLS